MRESPDCRDQKTYDQALSQLGEIFQGSPSLVVRIRDLAEEIARRIAAVSPFIELATQSTCPSCKDVCCISRHGYYSFEDLVYIHALGLKPPPPVFGKSVDEPCRFLGPKGCSMERGLRPSGCNWYICDALFDYMETRPDYPDFDDSLTAVAELWMEMMEEYSFLSRPAGNQS